MSEHTAENDAPEQWTWGEHVHDVGCFTPPTTCPGPRVIPPVKGVTP